LIRVFDAVAEGEDADMVVSLSLPCGHSERGSRAPLPVGAVLGNPGVKVFNGAVWKVGRRQGVCWS